MTTLPPLPATGAWLPGDEPGHRKFFTFATDRRFALDSGVALSDVVLAYQTWAGSTPTPPTPSCCAMPGPATATLPVPPAAATTPPAGGTTWSVRARPSTPIATSWCAPTCSEAARDPPARHRRTPTTDCPTGPGSR